MSHAMPNCREIEDNACRVRRRRAAPRSNRGTIEAHLQACPACARRAVAERAARELVCARRQRLRGCAPGDLAAALRGAARERSLQPAAAAFTPYAGAAVAGRLAAARGRRPVHLRLGQRRGNAMPRSWRSITSSVFSTRPRCRHQLDATLMGRTWQEANGWSLKVAASSHDRTAPAPRHPPVRLDRRPRRAHHVQVARQPLSVYVLNEPSIARRNRCADTITTNRSRGLGKRDHLDRARPHIRRRVASTTGRSSTRRRLRPARHRVTHGLFAARSFANPQRPVPPLRMRRTVTPPASSDVPAPRTRWIAAAVAALGVALFAVPLLRGPGETSTNGRDL